MPEHPTTCGWHILRHCQCQILESGIDVPVAHSVYVISSIPDVPHSTFVDAEVTPVQVQAIINTSWTQRKT